MTFLKGGRMLTPPTEFLNSDILKFHFDFHFRLDLKLQVCSEPYCVSVASQCG